MNAEGPVLETLTRRLAETPADFLAPPLIAGKGEVDVAAVVSDLLRDLGGTPFSSKEIERFRPSSRAAEHRNRLRAVLIAAWLFHDVWFRVRGRDAGAVLAFLRDTIPELTSLVSAESLVTDPDRREELARLGLKALGLRPAGETVAQALDRLQTLSSLERQRVIQEARKAEERARKIREAEERRRAQEAVAEYGET